MSRNSKKYPMNDTTNSGSSLPDTPVGRNILIRLRAIVEKQSLFVLLKGN